MNDQQQQQQLFEPDFGWFHFFRELIKSGKWSKLSGAACKLYPAIKSYTAAENGSAWPSMATLMEATGLSRDSVNRAVQELVQAELLTKVAGTGKRSNRYAINESWRLSNGTATAIYKSNHVADIMTGLRTGTSNYYVQIINNNNAGDVTVQQIDIADIIKQIIEMLDK